VSDEELVRDFTEGRISRRVFVRRLVDGGMPMMAAVSHAEALVPTASPSTGVGRADESDAPANVTMSARPRQVDGTEVTFVGDGYIIYHPAQDRMHSLNHTAALVLELCTGESDVDEIARLLQQAFQLPEPPEEETRHCLAVLFDEGLIR
jgi:hypothetical protein